MEKLNLEVTIEEAELIISSLQAQPFNRVNVVIQNLVQQCNEQIKSKEDIPGFEGTMGALDEL